MNLKIYYNYSDYENDINGANLDSESYKGLIGFFQNYLDGFKQITVYFDKPYTTITDKEINYQTGELEDLAELLNEFNVSEIDFKESLNFLYENIRMNIHLESFEIFIPGKKNYRLKTLDFLLYDKDANSYNWYISEELTEHLYLIETIITDLKNRLFKNKTIDNQNPKEEIENDFSNNEDKEKLIILEKLKIIDYIKSIQTKPETISHTAEILSAITGINPTTLYTYLRPMLNANRDNADKNSPYKNNENILNANKTIKKLKIKNTDANN